MPHELPVDYDDVIVYGNEYIAHVTINRGHLRLIENDTSLLSWIDELSASFSNSVGSLSGSLVTVDQERSGTLSVPPSSSTAASSDRIGSMLVDENFVYFCVPAPETVLGKAWKKIQLQSF